MAFHLAAPCPPWLKQAWIDWLGPEKVLELYGGTELQAMTVISGTEWLAHRGSVGRPVIGEIQVRDLDGQAVPAGEEGEIWMRRGAGPARSSARPRHCAMTPARSAARRSGPSGPPAARLVSKPAKRRIPRLFPMS